MVAVLEEVMMRARRASKVIEREGEREKQKPWLGSERSCFWVHVQEVLFINFAYRRHTANGARIGGDDGDSRPEEFFCFFWIRKKKRYAASDGPARVTAAKGFLASKKNISRAWRIMAAVFSWEQNSVEREPTKRAASWGKIRGRVETMKIRATKVTYGPPFWNRNKCTSNFLRTKFCV